MKPRILFPALALALAGLAVIAAQEDAEKVHPIGYSDTPQLPHSKWKVHDIDRPRPAVVEPAAEPGGPPSDAIVLFDGSTLDQWVDKDGNPAAWKLVDGAMEINNTGDIFTKESFGDCQLHIEWRAPDPPVSNSQHRGNSGIFLMNRYEIQVLDCYDNLTYADGQAGGLYGQYPPLVNASRKPGEWQTYDIILRAPRFRDGELQQPGILTVIHNGVVTLNAVEILGSSGHKTVATYRAHEAAAPIRLQDHKDRQPLRYRNIWIRPIELHDGQE